MPPMPRTADCLFMINSLKINGKRVVLLFWPQRTLPATTPLNGSYLMSRPLCFQRRSKPRFCGIFGSFGNLRHLPILACQGPLQVADVPAARRSLQQTHPSSHHDHAGHGLGHMLPIAVGWGAADSSFRAPMAVAIIGGVPHKLASNWPLALIG